MNDDDALFETIAGKLDEARDLLGDAVRMDSLDDMRVGIAIAAVFLEKLARVARGDFSDVPGSHTQGSDSSSLCPDGERCEDYPACGHGQETVPG